MRDAILELLTQKGYKAMVPRQIMTAIGSDDLTGVMKTLNSLEDEHLIIHDNVGHYATLEYFHVYLGTIDIKEAGVGFVRVEGETKDIFVSKKDKLNAMDKDLVYVQVTKRMPKGPEGVVIEIVKRNTTHLIGVLKKKNNHYNLEFLDRKDNLSVTIFPKNTEKTKLVY